MAYFLCVCWGGGELIIRPIHGLFSLSSETCRYFKMHAFNVWSDRPSFTETTDFWNKRKNAPLFTVAKVSGCSLISNIESAYIPFGWTYIHSPNSFWSIRTHNSAETLSSVPECVSTPLRWTAMGFCIGSKFGEWTAVMGNYYTRMMITRSP